MKRTVLAIALVVAGVGLVAAQADDPIKTRKDLMKSNGDHYDVLSRMSEGQDPYDAEKVAAAFEDFLDTAAKVPELFAAAPPRGADTKALPRIWQAKADFLAKNNALIKAINDTKDKAATPAALRTALRRVGDACGGCHERYRKSDPPPPRGKR